LLRVRRQQLHSKVAGALQKHFSEMADQEPETLAQHYEAAGLMVQAIMSWQRAGERANDRSANAEAENHLQRALRLIESLPAGPEHHRLELQALTTLGRVLTAKSGYGSSEVEKVYSRAHRLCETVDPEATAFPVLLGLTIYSAVRADLVNGVSLSKRLLSLAEGSNNPALLVEAHYAAGITHDWRGEFREARQHLTLASQNYQTGQHKVHLALYGQDPGPISLCRGAHVLWDLGYSDQATAQMRDALVMADQLSHPFSKAYVLSRAAWLLIMKRDYAEAERCSVRALQFAREQEYPFWIALAILQEGWLIAQQGDARRAIVRLEEGLAQTRAAGTQITQAYSLGLLGGALATIGQAQEGVQLIDKALADVRQRHEGWCEAELLRLRGEILLAGNSDARRAAEISLRHAIEKAQEQSAKAWELRAATSLARLWAEQDHRIEARDLLGHVYDWFSEGFDTADLKDARQLLDSLA
jgi:predicted ATPase